MTPVVINLDTFVSGVVFIQNTWDAAEWDRVITPILGANWVTKFKPRYESSEKQVMGYFVPNGLEAPWLVGVVNTNKAQVIATLAHELCHLAEHLCGHEERHSETRARIVSTVMKKVMDKYVPT